MPDAAALFAHEVDHIVAQKHGGATTAENLALSCITCNKYKGSDIASIDPETGKLEALFHPRKQNWTDNFAFVGGQIMPLTATGVVTTRLLQLNLPFRVAERELLRVAKLGEE